MNKQYITKSRIITMAGFAGFMLYTRVIEKKAPKVNGLLARGGRHTLFILCAHYPIMQIFIQAVGKFTGITSESGMSYQIVGALSIVVTLFICIIGDILLSKLIRKKEDRK